MPPIMSKTQLIKRGSCCGNGCTLCPYFPRAQKGTKELFKVPHSSDDFTCRPCCSIKTMQEGECICYMNSNM